MFEVNKKAISKSRNVFCVIRPLKDRSRSMERETAKSKDHKQGSCESVSEPISKTVS